MENWNPNDHQGRTKEQAEGNEKIATIAVAALILLIIGFTIKILF
jgi:hypothetical protein